jgi:hypothetical protein
MDATMFARRQGLDRSDFVKMAGSAFAGSLLAGGVFGHPVQAGQFTGTIEKAVQLPMVVGDMLLTDKFKLLQDLGFDGMARIYRRKLVPKPLEPFHDRSSGSQDHPCVAMLRFLRGKPAYGKRGMAPNTLHQTWNGSSAPTDLNRQVFKSVGQAFLPALGRQECLPHLSTEVGWGTSGDDGYTACHEYHVATGRYLAGVGEKPSRWL